jgi:Tfp pilus assembly protein PilV
MRAAPANPKRGAILLETLIALALFVAAASMALGATRNVFNAVDHARRRLEAVDLARSKLAELEAGHITLGDLRGEFDAASSQIGSQRRSTRVDATGSAQRWVMDVKTRRTEFTGLSLVELTVREFAGSGSGRGQNEGGVSCTLRQLVALRHVDAQEYESDKLSEDLPQAHSEDRP